MNVRHIDQLESRLEALTEVAFARLFRRAISARDIAVLLLRAIESNAIVSSSADETPTAPDRYIIQLQPEIAAGFLEAYEDFTLRMARLIVALCQESGYQLRAQPKVTLQCSAEVGAHIASITAEHSAALPGGTAAMPPVNHASQPDASPSVSWLHIDGARVVPLSQPVINIGRSQHNDIVIADAYMSREHLQLRAERGCHTLVDLQSRGGTRVNESAVASHHLQNGDVIKIGSTTLVYSRQSQSHALERTAPLPPAD